MLRHKDSMLWLGMGLGKTIITLSALTSRMRANQVQKTLVFGPLRVIHSVWAKEARKWSHTKHLTFSVVHGDKETRLRRLFTPADIYLCNYENMNWLAAELDRYFLSQGKPLPFQMVVYDEVSKLKNSTTVRMQGGNRDRLDKHKKEHVIHITGWRKFVDQFDYRVGLTGTPAPNGYVDLHGQYLAVDGGVRLGEYITPYRDRFFTQDWNGWKYTPTVEGKKVIEQLVADVTINMESKDYLDLPEFIVTNLMVDLPPNARKCYDELEAELFTQLDSGDTIELYSKQTVGNKLLQLCNGQPYTDQSNEDGAYDILHSVKLEALESVLEEAAGEPVLCSYSFRSDSSRIMKHFKKYKPVDLTRVPASRTQAVIESWNRGEIRLLIGHPASMGHGIDELQQSGSIVVWFGINWSWELYNQMNCRLDRQGQTKVGKIIRILCRDTVDLAVADAIERKANDEQGLKSAMNRYRQGMLDNDLTLNFF